MTATEMNSKVVLNQNKYIWILKIDDLFDFKA